MGQVEACDLSELQPPCQNQRVASGCVDGYEALPLVRDSLSDPWLLRCSLDMKSGPIQTGPRSCGETDRFVGIKGGATITHPSVRLAGSLPRFP